MIVDQFDIGTRRSHRLDGAYGMVGIIRRDNPISKVRPPVDADRGASTRTKNASAMAHNMACWPALANGPSSRSGYFVTIKLAQLPACRFGCKARVTEYISPQAGSLPAR